MRYNLAHLPAMRLSTCPSLQLQGRARLITGRGRQCNVTAIKPHRENLLRSALGHSAAQHAEANALDLDRLLAALTACGNDVRSMAQVIKTDFPELHLPIKQLAQQLREAPVPILHKEDTSRKQIVSRSHLLRASSTCAAAEPQLREFLKQQLQIAADQKVKITFSAVGSPSEAQEYELTDEMLEQYPVAYIVGYAKAWFVAEQ